MPSRKRAKGRARKLKQQARESAVERSVSQLPQSPNGENENINGGNINLPEQNTRTIEQVENDECDHGGPMPPRGHPVADFIHFFMEKIVITMNRNMCVAHFMNMTLVEDQEFWKDFAMRKMVIDTMLSIGTHFIIGKDIGVGRMISEAIIILEKYTSEGAYDSVVSKTTEDIGYIRSAEERDVVRFYYKRIPCSCLDEIYSEIKKSQDRGGECFHCKKTVNAKISRHVAAANLHNTAQRNVRHYTGPLTKKVVRDWLIFMRERIRSKLQEVMRVFEIITDN